MELLLEIILLKEILFEIKLFKLISENLLPLLSEVKFIFFDEFKLEKFFSRFIFFLLDNILLSSTFSKKSIGLLKLILI